jgi:hypothetical protein
MLPPEYRNSAVKGRRKSPLNFNLEKNLSSYALVAGMAGVGVLALAHPAEAEVVFTATHQLLAPNSVLLLDLNRDGITDASFTNATFATHVSYPGSYGSVHADGVRFGNQIVATSPSQYAYAAALDSGFPVSGKANFGSFERMNFCRTNPSHHTRFRHGPWINVKNKFVGIKFHINAQTHFGWARFSMKQDNYCQTFAVLTGYAYETVANKPIVTGKPPAPEDAKLPDSSLPPDNPFSMPSVSALGSLALGAPGLTVWRKEERN